MKTREEKEVGFFKSALLFVTWPFRKVWEIASNPSKGELIKKLEYYKSNEQEETAKLKSEVAHLRSRKEHWKSAAKKEKKKEPEEKARLELEIQKLKKENDQLQGNVRALKESLAKYPFNNQLSAADRVFLSGYAGLGKHKYEDERLRPMSAEKFEEVRRQIKLEKEREKQQLSESSSGTKHTKGINRK